MVNKVQTPSRQSKPNEGIQLHPELLVAAVHGDPDETKRLLLLLHREEDAAARRPVEVILDVEEAVAGVKRPAATAAIPPSKAVTGAGDSVLHVVASSRDADEFLESATVIVGKANHLLGARNRKGDTPLHCAAQLRNARMVSHLLALARAGDSASDERDGACDERVKAILRVQNGKGETVLHEAVRVGDKEMIGLLLSADSQLARVPLSHGASPLYLALSLGHRDIAQQLFEIDRELSYSGPEGQNAFHAAILWKRGEEATKMLLERNKDLLKQAERSTGWTPLHLAALFGETSVTKLLLSADPSPAYLPDSNGSFAVHLAASRGQPADNVLALLRESGPYCAQLRDGKGKTFLHVAVEEGSLDVVMHACSRWQGERFASSVMNMQDDEGNTALHLAVQVGDVRIVHALVSVPEVKLNLTNNNGDTPRELAFIWFRRQGTNSRYSNPRSRIYRLLRDAANLTASPPPRENILPREAHNEEGRSQSIEGRTQIIALGSVLITAVTYAAAFAVPGGYRADGTPALAGQYAFDAFVMANTLAFVFSTLSITFLMFAGLGAELGRRIFSMLRSVNFLAISARSLGAAFAFGMYAVLAPVERANAIASCGVTVGALMLVEDEWALRAVKMVYRDKVVLVKRFGTRRARLRLALAVLVRLVFELAPYIAISLSGWI